MNISQEKHRIIASLNLFINALTRHQFSVIYRILPNIHLPNFQNKSDYVNKKLSGKNLQARGGRKFFP